MGSKLEKKFSKVKDRIHLEQTGVNSDNVTAFLAGMAVSMVIITALSYSGVLSETVFDSADNSVDTLPADEVANKTVDMVNTRILHNTPNNVTAELVSVETADDEGLPQFYKVSIDVRNPTNSQLTEVFALKNGELVFLQFPRYFDQDKYEAQKHY